jgi:hypothetical protein
MSCPIACPVGLWTAATFALAERPNRRDWAATHDENHEATE